MDTAAQHRYIQLRHLRERFTTATQQLRLLHWRYLKCTESQTRQSETAYEMLGSEQDVLLELLAQNQHHHQTISNENKHTEYGPIGEGEQFGSVMTPDSCYSRE
jgi:hypothetical protein